MILAFFDSEKAYDKVERRSLAAILGKSGVDRYLETVVQALESAYLYF